VTPSDGPEFCALLAWLGEMLDKPVSQARMEGYFSALQDLTLAEVKAAVEATVRTDASGFFPPVAALRHAVLGTAADRALLAWDRVVTAIRCHGPRASVSFEDPVIHSAIADMGGWETLALLPSDPREQAYRAADFAKHYRARSVKLPAAVPPYLPGQCERENRASFGQWTRGLDHRDEVLILDADGRGVLAKRPALRAAPRALDAAPSALPDHARTS
jgi:hypothetical protein